MISHHFYFIEFTCSNTNLTSSIPEASNLSTVKTANNDNGSINNKESGSISSLASPSVPIASTTVPSSQPVTSFFNQLLFGTSSTNVPNTTTLSAAGSPDSKGVQAAVKVGSHGNSHGSTGSYGSPPPLPPSHSRVSLNSSPIPLDPAPTYTVVTPPEQRSVHDAPSPALSPPQYVPSDPPKTALPSQSDSSTRNLQVDLSDENSALEHSSPVQSSNNKSQFRAELYSQDEEKAVGKASQGATSSNSSGSRIGERVSTGSPGHGDSIPTPSPPTDDHISTPVAVIQQSDKGRCEGSKENENSRGENAVKSLEASWRSSISTFLAEVQSQASIFRAHSNALASYRSQSKVYGERKAAIRKEISDVESKLEILVVNEDFEQADVLSATLATLTQQLEATIVTERENVTLMRGVEDNIRRDYQLSIDNVSRQRERFAALKEDCR